MSSDRLWLSPPHLDERDKDLVLAALDSNWVAPAGPDLDAFEAELAEATDRSHAVALSSGTAALHLALHALGIGPGDEVLVPTLTFAATVNAVLYTGATPVLVDCDPDTWTMDPELVRESFKGARRIPRAVLPVDLYGQCADHDALLESCAPYGATLVVDAAESLGATYRGRPAGAHGVAGVLSFNGNKIITCSAGGAVVTDDAALAARVRHLSAQAREPVAHYEHREVGFNYRMSNILAALGRGQLARLADRVAARRRINDAYREALGNLPGVSFMPQASYGQPTWWLTCVLLDPDVCHTAPEQVRLRLEVAGIESRRTWKPMHLQPAYAGLRALGGAHAQRVFDRGLCLPSGSALRPVDVQRVAEALEASIDVVSTAEFLHQA